jgi:CheY-like chemotaxis protein
MDDEETFRNVIRHIAQDAAFDVLEAADGETGTQLALDQRPDIIVPDLQMPRMDGFTALAKLAESNVRAEPVIVCTSRTLTTEQKPALSSAYAIVPKSEASRDGMVALMRAVMGEPAEAKVEAR